MLSTLIVGLSLILLMGPVVVTCPCIVGTFKWWNAFCDTEARAA